MKLLTLVLLLSGLVFQVHAASQYQHLQDIAKADGSYACSKSDPCEIGCCGPLYVLHSYTLRYLDCHCAI